MLIRLLCIAVALALGGCASSGVKTQNEQILSRMTELEKNQQAKDAEIVDLQYQVKDLSSKLETSKAAQGDQPAAGDQVTPQEAQTPQASQAPGNPLIVRVKVPAEKIQMALKAAGVYTGPLDGKIGPGTKAAIVEFQKSHGLKADGILGRRTWEELKAYLR